MGRASLREVAPRWVSSHGEASIARIPSEAAPTRDGPRVNREITARSIRLVGADGEMVGVVSLRDALLAAEDAGLDLVEIAPQAEPPVCKILDYGKYKYEAQKKAAEARKKQKIIEVKEIKLRPNIDDNDYDVKMRSARRFLEEGDKVKVTMRFRGREMAHQDLGMNVLVRVRDELDELAKVEQMPKLEGRQMVMVLAPR
ncbi:translation initiation factor IF-3 [Azospirillum formosense]|nr:translation initiation factor IF-3 [Azospirillum formosense]